MTNSTLPAKKCQMIWERDDGYQFKIDKIKMGTGIFAPWVSIKSLQEQIGEHKKKIQDIESVIEFHGKLKFQDDFYYS